MSELYYPDTIAAIATAPGYGGIGIIRLSGKSLFSFIQSFYPQQPLSPRLATRCHFTQADGTVIDSGLLLYFPAPNSFTGEEVLELHGHGGPVVLNMLLNRCLALGARLAEPGEFSKRAFLNGKLDLTQAEGIADLINAQTEAAAHSAILSLQGGFSTRVHQLVTMLTDLRMLIEATLDFPEEDIDLLEIANAQKKLTTIQQQLTALLKTAQQGVILREGMQVVLIGPPNVGKSTLMNALADKEIAIVTNIAGTTRDLLKTEITIGQVPFLITDTAGLHETNDEIEKLGISRTLQAIEQANIAIVMTDHSAADQPDEIEAQLLSHLPDMVYPIFVRNKIDLTNFRAQITQKNNRSYIQISAKTGEGIDLLRQILLTKAGWQGHTEGIFLARQRHLEALNVTQQYLEEADINYYNIEIMAECLRLAQQSLGKITGEFTADDLLGEIFSRFCIGK